MSGTVLNRLIMTIWLVWLGILQVPAVAAEGLGAVRLGPAPNPPVDRLEVGTAGPTSIQAYVQDNGTFNAPVGHRRWILLPDCGGPGVWWQRVTGDGRRVTDDG